MSPSFTDRAGLDHNICSSPASRKQQLIKGLKEFRDIREDLPKSES
jgi:hypothetical protein